MSEDSDAARRVLQIVDRLGIQLAVLTSRVERLEGELRGLSAAEEPRQQRLGERLRRRRKELGLTQETTGEILRVDQSTIAKWERGDRMEPHRLVELAMFLRCDHSELVSDWLAEWGE